MSTPTVKQIVEGALLAAGGPLTLDQLLGLYADDERPPRAELQSAIAALAEDYRDRGIELAEVAAGWRVQVRQECAPWVARLWEEKPARYSRALLETLALIAYRQPITRGEIEDIRGVAVSTNIVKTLTERDWIRVVGHRDVPGRPALFATTRRFLDYFGLRSLNELPPLAEIRDPAFLGLEPDLLDDPQAQSAATAEDGARLRLVVAAGLPAAEEAADGAAANAEPDAEPGAGPPRDTGADTQFKPEGGRDDPST